MYALIASKEGAGGMDFYQQQAFDRAERDYLTPPDIPDYDEVMENYDEYADNDAWFGEMSDLEYEEWAESRITGGG